jgi:hypothetical protein
MKPIPFSGMLCSPMNIEKDGEFRIKGTVNVPNNTHPPVIRYENFACSAERDKRFDAITKLLKETR